MKKFLALLLAALMVFALVACGGNTGTTEPSEENTESTEPTEVSLDDIPDTMESTDGKYELAFVTDVGELKDKSFNQGTWEGLKKYAYDNKLSYKYYQPANGSDATDDDRYDAMAAAANAGAKVVICSGFMHGTALAKAAEEFADVKFVFIDGWPLSDSKEAVLANVAAVDFQEEQSGFLAGYAAVKEGYTKLGFSGGGGGTNPACCRFGYGFVQGAEAAAKEDGVKVEMNYTWAYGTDFIPSSDLQTMLNGWYTNGTEIIFSCGGKICESVFNAASENDGKVIGVDVDQSSQSDTVITSALKGISAAVIYILEKAYANEWDAVGGKQTTLGAADDAVGLPTDNWMLEKFTVESYNELFAKLKSGEYVVDRDYEKLDAANLEAVTLNIV